jgi:putative salt-induced outer membrane protein YdiY
VLVFLSAFRTPTAAAADKTDVVVMNNGDRFVGEIKSLEVGQLEFKASYMASSVDLDWTKVTQLESTRRFRVEFADGLLASGSISKSNSSSEGADFEVVEIFGALKRNHLEVVSLQPLENSIWSRFRGSADVGLTLQPEVGQTTWTANLTVDFPAEKFRVDSQVSSYFDSQENAESSVRQSFAFSYYQYLSKKYFLIGMAGLLKDNQLNLDLRSTFSAGAGRFLMHSTRQGLAVFAGLAATNEKYFDTTTDSNRTSAEALTGLEYYSVRFASSQIKTKLLVYPSLSEWGRVRVDWESSFSWEIFKDFYWKMSILENYDSRPPEGASNNDFTMTTSLGISF